MLISVDDSAAWESSAYEDCSGVTTSGGVGGVTASGGVGGVTASGGVGGSLRD